MELMLALSVFVFSTNITPGPNNIMLMSSGANYGVRRTILHLLGVVFGFALMLILVGLGGGVLFETFPVAYQLVKVFGIGYMSYLAFRIASAGQRQLGESTDRPMTFMQTVLFQWVNGKAWIMVTGAVATFTTASGNYLLQVLLIAATFITVGSPCNVAWVLCGRAMKGFLNDRIRQRIFNLLMGGLLFVSILPSIVGTVREFLIQAPGMFAT
jgi:threonine/homoserine/homoserine lactone efflux protein